MLCRVCLLLLAMTAGLLVCLIPVLLLSPFANFFKKLWFAFAGLLFWEPNPEGNPPQAISGHQELVGLQAVLVAVVLALVAYVQEKPEFSYAILAGYLAISFLPLLGMWRVVVGRHHDNDTHLAFDRSTTMSGKIFFWSGTALVVLFTGFYISGVLSKSKPVEFPIVDVEEYKFQSDFAALDIKKGDEGLKAFAKIESEKYPDTLLLNVHLQGLAKGWVITNIQGFEDATGKTPTFPQPDDLADVKVPVKRIHWPDLENGKTYYLQILLFRRDKNATLKTTEMSNKLTEDSDDVILVRGYVPR